MEQLVVNDSAPRSAGTVDWNEIVNLATPDIRSVFDKLSTPTQFVSDTKPAALNEWTVAIDIGLYKGPFGRVSDAKLKALEDLAARTKDKPITFLVQRTISPDKARIAPENKEADAQYVEKFLIRDGSVKALGTTKSKGLAENAGDLLEDALKNHPSQKLSLFMLCHGVGNRGLGGDSGKCSLAEFSQNLKRRLGDDSKKQIDVLNFDGCLMAQDAVVSALKPVASRMVASTEVELSSPTLTLFNAQNQSVYLEKLIANPSVSAEQFGKLIIDAAKQGSNDAPKEKVTDRPDTFGRTGTPSLSLLNLHAEKDFTESLNTFGNELAEALKNNSQSISNLIELTPRFGPDGYDRGIGENQKRDLKTFAELVTAAIDKGTITDTKGTLKKSANSVLNARNQLVEDFHGYAGPIDQSEGATNNSYDKTGGISVFLPGSKFRSPEDAALTRTPIGRLISWSQTSTISKDKIAEIVTHNAKEATENAPKGSTNNLLKAIDQLNAIISKGTQADYDREIANVRREAQLLVGTAWNKEASTPFKEIFRDQRDSIYPKELSSPGWTRFVNELKSK